MSVKFTVTNIDKQPDGRHADEIQRGLYLSVRTNPATGNKSRSWLMIYTYKSVPGAITLGSVDKLTLKDARDQVKAKQVDIGKGIDPNPKKQIAAPVIVADRTFKQDAKAYFERESRRWVAAYQRSWWSSLENHVFNLIGDKITAKLTVDDIVGVFAPIWDTMATADVIFDRVRLILEYAIDCDDHDHFKGNVAIKARKRHLAKRVQVETPHGALPWREAPALYAKLVAMGDNPAAQGLRFLLLCNSPRANEVVEATWSEIKGDLFHVPANRMKSRVARVIPLSQAALDVLTEIQDGGARSGFVFTTKRKGKMLNPTGGSKRRPTGGEFIPFAGHMQKDAMLLLFQRLVATEVLTNERGTVTEIVKQIDPENGAPWDIHGLRATFRTWVSDHALTVRDHDAAEISLDHVIGNKVHRAYDRADMVIERRDLATRWAAFLMGVKTADSQPATTVA